MARFIPAANQRVDTHSFQYGLGSYYVEICQLLCFLCYRFKFCLHLHLSLEMNLSFCSSAFMDNGVWADRLQLSSNYEMLWLKYDFQNAEHCMSDEYKLCIGKYLERSDHGVF